MKHKLLDSTAGYSLGLGFMQSLLSVNGGEYDGRLVAFMLSSANVLKMTWADPPYTGWTTATDIDTNAADLPHSACMLDDGSILLVYSTAIDLDLVVRKLTFSGGTWNIGAAVTVYNGDPAASPTVAVAPDGTYWISYIRFASSKQYLHVKPSTDDGQTWGYGPESTGDQMTPMLDQVNCRLVAGDETMHAVYVKDDSDMVRRSYDTVSGLWSVEDEIVLGVDIASNFNAAFSANNILHVVWDDGGIKYRRHNGSFWEDVITIDSDGGRYPDLYINDGRPTAVYLKEVAPDRHSLFAAGSDGLSFLEPQPIDRQYGTFKSVLAYAAGDATYEDMTDAAADTTTADLFHPITNGLLSQVDDQLFIGFDNPFRMIGFELATAGVGGQVSWAYWDGINWQSFTPSGAAWDFDTASHNLVLFTDYDSIPVNWQRTMVEGEFLYWIRARTTTGFTTAPVGSRMLPTVRLKAFTIAR